MFRFRIIKIEMGTRDKEETACFKYEYDAIAYCYAKNRQLIDEEPRFGGSPRHYSYTYKDDENEKRSDKKSNG